jgi:hypothetical protein
MAVREPATYNRQARRAAREKNPAAIRCTAVIESAVTESHRSGNDLAGRESLADRVGEEQRPKHSDSSKTRMYGRHFQTESAIE